MSTKQEIYAEAEKYWNPTKVQYWKEKGIDIVLGKREGYCFYTLEGKKIINLHLNGGVYNLGHRNPEVIEALVKGTEQYDAGNHYFPSVVKTELAKNLVASCPDELGMKYINNNNGGGESIDAAIKFARNATGRRRVVSVTGGFHGATGLAHMAGNHIATDFFNCTQPEEEFTIVKWNSLDAMEEVLEKGDTACVVLESIPATAGFVLPDDDYLKGVEQLCHKYGALYIADEVQVGLMRSGEMWCCCNYGAKPDMIVTGKGLSGGMYPMSAVIMNEKASSWMKVDGGAHLSSFSTSEIGCVVALKALEITSRESTKANVAMLTKLFHSRLTEIVNKHSFLTTFYQKGVIMGLQTDREEGAYLLMQELYKRGVWAIRAAYNPSILQFKAGLLMDADLANEALDILDDALTAIEASL